MTLDAREFRDAMGCFATGITVVTARSKDGENVGCTANSFSSVSLDPPLVLWAIAKNANSYDAFMEAEHFAIHVLHAGQEDMSRLFATKDVDKFSEISWTEGQGARHCWTTTVCDSSAPLRTSLKAGITLLSSEGSQKWITPMLNHSAFTRVNTPK